MDGVAAAAVPKGHQEGLEAAGLVASAHSWPSAGYIEKLQ